MAAATLSIPYGGPPVGFALAALLLTGCVSSQLVSPEMESRIARDLSFESLKVEPAKFKGRMVVLGGKVLGAKRFKEVTRIEVLQLPLDGSDIPRPNLIVSQGRFLALQTDFLDPATIPAGTLVSMIAEVVGVKTMPLDEVDYHYPLLKVSVLKIWGESDSLRYGYWPPIWAPYPYGPYGPMWWDPWY
jgi:outer membrane lipoprotein